MDDLKKRNSLFSPYEGNKKSILLTSCYFLLIFFILTYSIFFILPNGKKGYLTLDRIDGQEGGLSNLDWVMMIGIFFLIVIAPQAIAYAVTVHKPALYGVGAGLIHAVGIILSLYFSDAALETPGAIFVLILPFIIFPVFPLLAIFTRPMFTRFQGRKRVIILSIPIAIILVILGLLFILKLVV